MQQQAGPNEQAERILTTAAAAMPCLRRLKQAHDLAPGRRPPGTALRPHTSLDGPASGIVELDSGSLVRPDQVYACREAFESRVLDVTVHAPWHVCATEWHKFRRTVQSHSEWTEWRGGPNCRLLEEAGGLLDRPATSDRTIV